MNSSTGICQGFVGGHLNRQGYYSAVPSTAKQYMEGYEWDYWMLGKAAAKDIKAPDGKKLARCRRSERRRVIR
jgi:putative spermidine/putrescine transport system substrate-binding protein